MSQERPQQVVIPIRFALVALTLLAMPAMAMPLEPADITPTHVRLGMDMPSAAALDAHGAPAELGAIWAGAWLQTAGWDEVERLLDEAAARNITPVIHFWYWGDSISPACVENGCYDALHAQHLSMEGWQSIADGIATRVAARFPGNETIVVLESEFNKGGIDAPENAAAFDARLAAQMERLRAGAPGMRVALGFGGWGHERWGNFPLATQSADLLSMQAMRGSTHDDAASYEGVVAATVENARMLNARFGKHVIVSDLALSSYGGPEWEARQAATLAALLDARPALARAQVEGIVYRSLADNPHMDPENYFGEAERHWGFARADGSAKPALDAWVNAAAAQTSRR